VNAPFPVSCSAPDAIRRRSHPQKQGFGSPSAPQSDGIITTHRAVSLSILVARLCAGAGCRCPRAAPSAHSTPDGVARQKRIVERGVGSMRAVLWLPRSETCTPPLAPAFTPAAMRWASKSSTSSNRNSATPLSYFQRSTIEIRSKTSIRCSFLPRGHRATATFGPQIHLDLVEANRRQLIDAGVPADNISASKECTSCRT